MTVEGVGAGYAVRDVDHAYWRPCGGLVCVEK